MARLPVFVGSFLLGMSVFVCAVGTTLITVLDRTYVYEETFYLGILIYVCGIVGGVGVGLAIGGEEEYKRINTVLGAIGLALMVAFSFWFFLLGTADMNFPIMSVAASLVAALIAFVGLWIALVGRSNQ